MFFLIILTIMSSAFSLEIYKQCGGIAYSGSTRCDPIYPTCIVKDKTFAQCIPNCPSLVWTCKNQSSIKWQSGDWAYGCDFPQRHLATAQTTSSQCKTQCTSTNGCTHYTWSNSNGGTCWMKFGLVSKDFAFATSDSTMLCGVVAKAAQPINWGSNNWAFSCDFLGNDLANFRISGDKCGGKCEATTNCTHFTWTDYNGGTCWMKSGSTSKSDAIFTNNNIMVCGITEKIQWNIGDWANACDFQGNDIGSVMGTSANCRTSCLTNNKCTHYTWSNYNSGTCWMKNGQVSRADAFFTKDYSMECGIPTVNLYGQCGGEQYFGSPFCKPVYSYCFIQDKDYSQCRPNCDPNDPETKGWLCQNIDWQTGNWANNCEFKGNDFTNKPSTKTACGQLCADTKGCTHYTWTNNNGGICSMKSNNLISKLDAVVLNKNDALCGIIPVQKNLNCIGVDVANTIAVSSIDWSNLGGVSPVKNQLDCNSCWAFAALGAIESQYLIRKNKSLTLSVQNIIDCNSDFKCGSGLSESAFGYAAKYGINAESTYPYTGIKGNCKFNSNAIAGKILTFNYIDNDEEKMKFAISSIGPIVVFLNIDMMKNYPGGIFNDANCSPEKNHAALAVGYGTDPATGLDYWIVKNSWGTSWGEKGYLRIARKKNMCGIGYLAMYPVLEALPTECQCDGLNFVGPNNCSSNSCQFRSDYYAQCLSSKTCPSTWTCTPPTIIKPDISSAALPLYSQCGGYKMVTVPCQQGSCYMQTQYYSQCLLGCPSGWQCKTSIPGDLTLWKVNDKEIYIQNVSATDWQEIQGQTVLYKYTLPVQNKDVVTLFDKARNINLKLSAVDCKYFETDKVLYFGSWLSTYVQAIRNFMIWKAQSDDFYILSRENFKDSSSKNWIKFQKGNVVDYTFVSSSSDTVTIQDLQTSKTYKLNSNNMVDSSNNIVPGTWTSFCPGISIYGPSTTSNNTKATTTRPRTTTLKTTSFKTG